MADGEYIELWWDDDAPPEYVRGHVSPEVAYAAVDGHCGLGPIASNPFTHKHRWARWELPGMHGRACGLDKVMMVYDEKSRGTFAVTEMTFGRLQIPTRVDP